MPQMGELTFYDAIDEASRTYALRKPYSDPNCGYLLMQIGALLSILPSPPARILECGSGTGWFSHLLSQRGYDVVGVDVSPRAIELAQSNTIYGKSPNAQFRVADTESLPFDGEFDVVLFFDSLHHSIDERKAIESAFRALKPGGVCITSEPGSGHAERSKSIAKKFDTTEKDMPTRYIRKLARETGFQRCSIFPRFDIFGQVLIPERPSNRLKRFILQTPFRYLFLLWKILFDKYDEGIVVLHKG
jgi:SAM-dependent methyltransferase